MVGALRGMTEAGVYAGAAVRPHISTLHAEADRRAMQRAVATASCWATILAVGTCGVLIPTRGMVLQQFGEEFARGGSALLALSLANLVAGSTAVVHAVMNMTDHQRATMRISAVCLALKLPLSFAATSLWGVTGAAVVSGGVLAANCLWSWGYVRRTMGIDGTVLGRFRRRDAANRPRQVG